MTKSFLRRRYGDKVVYTAMYVYIYVIVVSHLEPRLHILTRVTLALFTRTNPGYFNPD